MCDKRFALNGDKRDNVLSQPSRFTISCPEVIFLEASFVAIGHGKREARRRLWKEPLYGV